jgi:uroporphyrinogen-III synthase
MRVAITTSRDRIPALAAEFATRGMEPVALPCVAIEIADAEQLAAARQAVNGADTLLLTSPRTPAILWDGTRPPELPVVAVGPATAAAAAAHGLTVEAVGTGGLVDVVSHLSGRHVFFPRAEATPTNALEAAAEAAASLTAPVVYRTVPQAPGDDPVDAVAFTSPTAVRGWLLSRSLEGLVVAAIGETTATALRTAGTQPDVVPPRPGFAALAQAVAERYS